MSSTTSDVILKLCILHSTSFGDVFLSGQRGVGMKLSLRFFYTKILDLHPEATIHVEGGKMPTFSSLGVITSGMTAASEVVYIDLLPPYEESVHREEPAAGISVITTQSRSPRFIGCNLITLPDSADLAEIVQLVSTTLMRYLGWADSIYEAIAKNMDLQTIIDLTAPILENPIYIADSSFKMLAMWGGEFGEVNPTWRYQERYLYLPHDVMQNISESGELKRLHETPKAWLVEKSKGFTALPYISKAIRKDGVHYGNFFIIAFYSQLTDCDLELADYLGMVLSTALQGNLNYLETSTLYHNHFLEDVIEGTLTDERIVNDQLKALRWKMQGGYMVAVFNTTEDNDGIRQHMMAYITSEFAAECFAYQGSTVVIFNESPKRHRAITKQLNNLAKNFNRTAAVSERFVYFSHIDKYYNQARFALDIADALDARGSVLEYSKVFLSHLSEVTGGAIPTFAPAAALYEHDRAQGTEYCRTLLTWLINDRNTIHAAEELYVHRNTLKNRLERIKGLVEVDLDDFRVRIRMQLSLCDLRREGRGNACEMPMP